MFMAEIFSSEVMYKFVSGACVNTLRLGVM